MIITIILIIIIIIDRESAHNLVQLQVASGNPSARIENHYYAKDYLNNHYCAKAYHMQ